MRSFASTASIILGVLLVLGGIATWIMVAVTLADQRIVTPDDAVCLPERQVQDPFTAYCQAMTIDEHALEGTDGLRYAELDREDPRRESALNASFLQASLFTSVVAFGIAAMAVALGLVFLLLGLGIRDVARRADVTVTSG